MKKGERDTMEGMLGMTTLPKRLSRPDNPAAFRITERDILILRALKRWRFMSSDQIERHLTLIYGTTSSQQVRRRLLSLFAKNYVDRPLHQHIQLSSFGFLVYGLGREGARLLAELGDGVENVQWTLKNKRASAAFLQHTLEIADAVLAFETACVARADVRLLDHADLLPYFPKETLQLDDPFRLRVSARLEGRPVALNVIPDRLFSLVLSGDQRLNFAAEIDRGTMSVAAARLTNKSSFARKIHAYLAAWQQQRHGEQWGFKSFRVLTIAPSERRIASMLTVQKKITNGKLAALFLYATPERLKASGAFGPAWISAEADKLTLLEG